MTEGEERNTTPESTILAASVALLGGAALLTACGDDESEGPEGSDVASGLEPGLSIPIVSSSIQDLGTTMPSELGLAPDKTAMVYARGAWQPGDGGDGFFFWDASAGGAPDTANGGAQPDVEGVYNNLGTFIRPDLVASSEPGRWRRVYAGHVDVRWFRAETGVWTAAFQRAIDTLSKPWKVLGYFPYGGEIHVPAGSYQIDQPLTLPMPPSGVAGLAFVGEGREASEIVLTSGVSADRALLEFETQLGTYQGWRFQDLTFRRVNRGRVIYHVATGSTLEDFNFKRLLYFTFERVTFEEGLSGTSSYPVVDLTCIFSSTWDDVVVRAVGVGLSLSVSSRNHISLIRAEPPPGGSTLDVGISLGAPAIGTYESLGGGHVLHRPDVAGNVGIRLDRVAGVIIVEPAFSGSVDNIQLTRTQDTIILSPHFEASGAALALFADTVSTVPIRNVNVQVRGGRFVPIGTGVLIDAESVQTLNVESLSYSSTAADVAARVVLGAECDDVAVDAVNFGGRSEVRRELIDIPGATTFYLARARGGATLAPPAPIDVHEILSGQGAAFSVTAPPGAGQRIKLFFTNDNVTLHTNGSPGLEAPIALSGGAASWSPSAGSMIELVFDGGAWRELRRLEGGA